MSSGKCKSKQRDTTTHLLGWAKSRILTASNTDEDVEQQELSNIAGGNAKLCSHFGRQFGRLLEELKTYVYTKICTWMFIAALFITAQIWKQPRCPL